MPAATTRNSEPPTATPDLNLRLLKHLAQYLADHYGRERVTGVAAAGGMSVDVLMAASSWVTLEQFEAVLAAARAGMRDDDEFRAACAYRLDEVSGPVRLIIGALSPSDAYELGARNMRLVSTISAFKPERQADGRLLIRYESSRDESRLMCLSRQAQIRELPTQWGLPPALVVEQSCLAKGDPACGYLVRVYESRRWLPPAVGCAAGGTAAISAHLALASPTSFAWVLPLVGAAVGYVLELNRSMRANRRTAREINLAYLDMARDDTRSRRELFDLGERQQAWTRVVEHQVATRAQVLEQFVDRLNRLIITPGNAGGHEELPALKELRAQVQTLRSSETGRGPNGSAVVQKLDAVVQRLDSAMDELVDLAADHSNIVSLLPQVLEVEPLAGELRNRLAALVAGKDIRVSAFNVREAPAQVRADVLLFNRIVDNLLTSAAAHTERGSIVVQVGGQPGFLTVQVSDTSRGLNELDVERVFSREPPPRRAILPGSSRLADLWMIARLLEQIGGRLEIKSMSGKGTTYEAHFPVDFGGRVARPAARNSEPWPGSPRVAEPARTETVGGRS